MKSVRSFSLLTFILLATVAAIGIALYSANAEVAEKRAQFKAYSEEMGFIDVEDESLIHVRKLGGYPQLSFAFRYQLPQGKDYTLHVGSGVVDPETGLPPILVSRDDWLDERFARTHSSSISSRCRHRLAFDGRYKPPSGNKCRQRFAAGRNSLGCKPILPPFQLTGILQVLLGSISVLK